MLGPDKYTTTITLDMYDCNELDFTVTFFINPGFAGTYWEPPEVEHVEDFDFEDEDVVKSGYTENQILEAIELYIDKYEDQILTDAWDNADYNYGDWLYEMKKDEGLL